MPTLESQVIIGDTVASTPSGGGPTTIVPGTSGKPYIIYVNNISELPNNGDTRLAVIRSQGTPPTLIESLHFFVWDDIFNTWREILSKAEWNLWITNTYTSLDTRVAVLESIAGEVMVEYLSSDYVIKSLQISNTAGFLFMIDAYTNDASRNKVNLDISYNTAMTTVTLSWLTNQAFKIYTRVKP